MEGNDRFSTVGEKVLDDFFGDNLSVGISKPYSVEAIFCGDQRS
jgi:hypothetical protein